jgi:hypothetical protein
MTALLDRLVRRNPLLAHGPRTHSTGLVLPAERPAPAVRRRSRGHVRWDVDAPRVHLGHAGRAA